MSNLLSTPESTQLLALERVIERGLKSFMEVGTALMEIRDNRLYRQTHSRFDEYCHERWDMNKEYANRLITSVHVVNSLNPTGFKPDSERVARPLAQLNERERPAAWEAAVQSAPGGKPTATQVQQAVNDRRCQINGEYGSEAPIKQTKPAVKVAPDVVQIFVPNDPKGAAQELLKHFSGDQLRALIAYLKDGQNGKLAR